MWSIRRRALTGSLVFVVAGLVVSCAGDGDGDEAAPVQLLVFGEPQEAAAYQDVIDAYEASHADAEVELTVASDRSDLLARVSTSIAAGTPPDLFLVNYRFYGQFASSGALEPVDQRLAESAVLEVDDFYPVALGAFQWQGTQMCLPQNISSLAVYYNEELFERAGLDAPPVEWTWTDMVEAAEALTVDTDGDGVEDQYGLGVEPGLIRVAPFVWSAGGEMFDDPVRPTTITLDTPQALGALERFVQLRTLNQVVPTDEEMESEDLESRFMNGRLGMFISSRRVVPNLRAIEDLSWDVASLPVIQEPVNVLHSDALCMTEGSSHHDDAWDFMEFAMGPAGQEILAATGRTVPSLRSVAESPAFLDPDQAPSSSQVFLDAIPHIRPLPVISTWQEVEDTADVLIEESMFETNGGEIPELVVALRKETQDAFDRAADGD